VTRRESPELVELPERAGVVVPTFTCLERSEGVLG
jgi:hypothetical protein